MILIRSDQQYVGSACLSKFYDTRRRSLKKLNTRSTQLVWATSRSRCTRRFCSSALRSWPALSRCTSTRWRGSSIYSWCLLTTLSGLTSWPVDCRTCRTTSPICCTATSVGRSSKRTRYSRFTLGRHYTLSQKNSGLYFSYNFPNVDWFSTLTGPLRSKRIGLMKISLKIPPYLKRVATLPRETKMSEN